MARFERRPPGWCLICRIRQILFVKIFSDWIYSRERHAWCSKSEILEMTKETPNHQLKRCCSSKRAIIHQKITKSNYFEDSWSKWEKSYCWHKKIFFRFSKFEKFRKPSPFLNRFVSKKPTIYSTKSTPVYRNFENPKKLKIYPKVFFWQSDRFSGTLFLNDDFVSRKKHKFNHLWSFANRNVL